MVRTDLGDLFHAGDLEVLNPGVIWADLVLDVAHLGGVVLTSRLYALCHPVFDVVKKGGSQMWNSIRSVQDVKIQNVYEYSSIPSNI